jgi:hypothetical protein
MRVSFRHHARLVPEEPLHFVEIYTGGGQPCGDGVPEVSMEKEVNKRVPRDLELQRFARSLDGVGDPNTDFFDTGNGSSARGGLFETHT